MQDNVNAIETSHNVENMYGFVKQSFGEENVELQQFGVVKVKVKSMGVSDIQSLNIAIKWCNDIEIKRSDKNIVILFTPRS